MEEFELIGIKLHKKSHNKNEQSAIDCGGLWQRFLTEEIMAKIPNKLSNEIFAVYYDFESDYTGKFAYFIGCKVQLKIEIPENLDAITIPNQNYEKIVAKGKVPECIGKAWQQIWNSDIPRKYGYDFEIYDERSSDWENAEIDIFLSIKS